MSLRLVATSRRSPQGCGPAGCGEYPHQADGPGMSRGTTAYGTDMSYPPDMRGGANLGYKDTAGGHPGWGRDDSRAFDQRSDMAFPANALAMEQYRAMNEMRERLAQMEHQFREMNTEARMRAMSFDSMAHTPQPMGFAAPLSTVKSKASEMVSEAEEVLSSPPPTWGPYLQKKDYIGLVKMEAREMLSAVENNKSPEDIKKEVKHVLAAVLKLIGD